MGSWPDVMGEGERREGAIVERVICTLCHEWGNQLFPLKYLLSKVERGEKLTEGERALMLQSYRRVERVLKWLSALNYPELQRAPYRSDKTGLINLIELGGNGRH